MKTKKNNIINARKAENFLIKNISKLSKEQVLKICSKK
jgi:hypothetical protein